ncbi:MAG TPA: response regulator [Thermoanaerobaculia bacterium]|jgi:CheY-like chemotaxis protein
MPTTCAVLIVEDDAAIRSLLAAALRRAQIEVEVASDGAEALEKVAHGSYGVIVADLMMPRMDGYAFLDALKLLTLPVKPVVFVMSAFDDSAFRLLDPAVVHGCFRKPFDVERVVSLVQDCVALLREPADEASEPLRELPPPPVC